MQKGMSKGISKENIVNITLELIRDRENIRSVNLREIARVLGCAHTNLYNHFSDLDGILWDALDEVLAKSADFLLTDMDLILDPATKLEHFYKRFLDFYLQNKGWFRLFWMEKLQGGRTAKNISLTTETVDKYVVVLTEIFEKLYHIKLTKQQVMDVFHTVHCYLHGELSIFISGRGLISEEKEFKKYVLEQCLRLNVLLVSSLGQEASI